MSQSNRHLLGLSAQIVAAHAANNSVEATALPGVIRCVFNALSGLLVTGLPTAAIIKQHPHLDETKPEHDHDANVASHAHNGYVHPTYGQTVFDDHLICMEDGLRMKMLKRHLLTVHGITPDEYREKWGLPESYPMVASDYAKLRSSLALQSGLGLKPEDRPIKGRKTRRS